MITKALSLIFKDYGIKTVSKTDKSKSAYVLNSSQVKVLKISGKKPGDSFVIKIIGDPHKSNVKATYYLSKRAGSGRLAEPRMGTEIISGWLTIGDKLFLASDGDKVYAMKLNDNTIFGATLDDVELKVLPYLSDDIIIKRAGLAPKKAKKEKKLSENYRRNKYVIEAAKRRAKGKCEMPGCMYQPFVTDDGRPYLEGHHVIPLGEGGEDAIDNVAALCPLCHRKQHYSSDKILLRTSLMKTLRKNKK